MEFFERKNKPRNTLVIGGAGAGKTYSYVIPRLLEADCSCVIHDPFGEILENTGDLLKEKDYDIRVLDLRFTGEKSEYLRHYNPFVYAEGEVNGCTMVDTILTATEDPDNKYAGVTQFVKAEFYLLRALMIYFISEYEPKDRNLTNLAKVFQGNSGDSLEYLDKIFTGLEEKTTDHFAVKMYKNFKENAGKEVKAVVLSCAVRLSRFRTKAVQELTSEDDIDLYSVPLKKTALFVISNPFERSYDAIVSQLLWNLIIVTRPMGCGKSRKELPIHFILDEFPGLWGFAKGFPPNMVSFLSQNKKCRFSFVVQSLYQLKNMYPEDWEKFVGNCDEIHYYGGNDNMTHEHISKLSGGKVTVKELHFMDRNKYLILRKCIFGRGYSAKYIPKKRWEKK